MGQVTISLNGRTYRLRCGEGEEPRLIELADMVRDKLTPLVQEFGQAGDDRLLLMTALLMADELLDTRARLAALSDPAMAAAAPVHAPEARGPAGGRSPRAERPRSNAVSAAEPPSLPLAHAVGTGTRD